MTVTPSGGIHFQIITAGAPVIAIPPQVVGGYIINPLSAADQGLGAPVDVIVDPVAVPGTLANNTALRLRPGERFDAIPNSSTAVMVNSSQNGHKLTVVFWL